MVATLKTGEVFLPSLGFSYSATVYCMAKGESRRTTDIERSEAISLAILLRTYS